MLSTGSSRLRLRPVSPSIVFYEVTHAAVPFLRRQACEVFGLEIRLRGARHCPSIPVRIYLGGSKWGLYLRSAAIVVGSAAICKVTNMSGSMASCPIRVHTSITSQKVAICQIKRPYADVQPNPANKKAPSDDPLGLVWHLFVCTSYGTMVLMRIQLFVATTFSSKRSRSRCVGFL